ncbi:MAG: META domain-containing protein [Chitinophagaceae bacterium]
MQASKIDIQQLQGIWKMTNIEGPTKDLADMYTQGMPILQINVNQKTISGFSGCNSYNSIFSHDDKKIYFNQPFSLTKKHCRGGGEAVYLETLKKVDNFVVVNNELKLKMGSVVVMTFELELE